MVYSCFFFKWENKREKIERMAEVFTQDSISNFLGMGKKALIISL